jgi:hypothetical protein
LILERGDGSGRSFAVVITTCTNPVCECNYVTLNCAEEEAGPPAETKPIPIKLEMDLLKRTVGVEKANSSPAADALARAVSREMAEPDWRLLDREYYSIKARLTESADLKRLVPMFQAEPQVRTGAMVGYYEFLPYARRIEVRVGTQTWLFDDQYCLSCNCRASALSFVHIPEVAPPSGIVKARPFSFRYDYGTARVELLNPLPPGHPSPSQFLDGLKQLQPDIASFLAKRRAVIQGLYQNSLVPRPAQPRPAMAKVGRNEPCPCGSGKKYKRCCARA